MRNPKYGGQVHNLPKRHGFVNHTIPQATWSQSDISSICELLTTRRKIFSLRGPLASSDPLSTRAKLNSRSPCENLFLLRSVNQFPVTMKA